MSEPKDSPHGGRRRRCVIAIRGRAWPRATWTRSAYEAALDPTPFLNASLWLQRFQARSLASQLPLSFLPGELETIAISQPFQRLAGSVLLSVLIRQLEILRGQPKITLEVRASNIVAQGLSTAPTPFSGFTAQEVLLDRGEDAVVSAPYPLDTNIKFALSGIAAEQVHMHPD